jgi:hypothetical protein
MSVEAWMNGTWPFCLCGKPSPLVVASGEEGSVDREEKGDEAEEESIGNIPGAAGFADGAITSTRTRSCTWENTQAPQPHSMRNDDGCVVVVAKMGEMEKGGRMWKEGSAGDVESFTGDS